jgi:hypothetical protein
MVDNKERDVRYVGRKRAEKDALIGARLNGWNIPASAFISSGVSLNAAIPRNINPISEPS